MMDNQPEKTFPATCVAHWPSGPVSCCAAHANALVAIGQVMACNVAVTLPAPDGAECANCKNEAKVA
jgi:hypothetical protein